MLDTQAELCKQAVGCSNVRSAAGLAGDKLRDNHPGQRRTSRHMPRHLVAVGFKPGLARTLDSAFGTKRQARCGPGVDQAHTRRTSAQDVAVVAYSLRSRVRRFESCWGRLLLTTAIPR